MPLAPIVQPVMWSFGDAMHLYPHPDILVLADECEDYFYHIPVNGHETTFHDAQKKMGTEDKAGVKHITVVNPGSFTSGKFTVLYPTA